MRTDVAKCDLVVIGGGTAGLVGAQTAAGFGARVILIERHRTGGDCLWTGCVPSKTLIAAARSIADARAIGSRAVDSDPERFQLAMQRVRAAIAAIAPVDSPAALKAAGVSVVHGEARFTGHHVVTVGERLISFRQALVVTGAAPTIPALPGLTPAEAVTSDTVWDLPALPPQLAILGGGPVAGELGQTFARLGSRVTVVGRADRLLPREDPDASRVVEAALRADGVVLELGATATSLVVEGDGRRLTLADGRDVVHDTLLVAIGNTARTSGIGLERLGVDLDQDGTIVVDDHLRTTNPWIWAAGDVTARSTHTHTAGMHGSIAATNAILGLRRTIDEAAVPRVTFTSPEVAAVGVGTGPGTLPVGARVRTLDHAHVDRAVTDGATDGFTRLAVDRRGRLIGATVVSPRAGETLGEVTLAVRLGLRPRDLAATTHPYPTFNDGVWNAAVADVRESLGSGPVRSVTRLLGAGRRAWVAWRQLRER